LSTNYFGDRAVLRHADHPAEQRPPLAAAFPTADVRVGLDSVLVVFASPDAVPPDAVDLVATVEPTPIAATQGRTIQIPISYSGPDLADIAIALDLASTEVIRRHSERDWQVGMLGFAPGFPYLVSRDRATNPFNTLARLTSPRAKVPAGSVGVAAGMTCIYPSELPGGWLLIGHTDLRLFDPAQSSPSTLLPGDHVRFRPVA
jgi:KipI family sensor histidine kinase inhibitor